MNTKAIWTGRVISALIGIFIFTSGINILFVHSADLVTQFEAFGYPERVWPVAGWAALISSTLYLIPQTSVFGAILLTAYLGGAVATHTRIEDPQGVVAVVAGGLVWLGVYLRNDRLRALVPLLR